MELCPHTTVTCVNPHIMIRKYRCESCGAVMMCTCDESFARKYLPHQIAEVRDSLSGLRVKVTRGFQEKICNACRGLPEPSFPRAEIYGRSSKILRYYWREISFETTRRFADWAKKQGFDDWLIASTKHRHQHRLIEKEVADEMRKQHEIFPKYKFVEKSQDEVLTQNNVEVVRLDAEFQHTVDNRLCILDGQRRLSPEQFAAVHLETMGYRVFFTESRPFHVLFGVFFWLLIQDPADPHNRMVSFGSRTDYDSGKKGNPIWTTLPEDFATAAYARRRTEAINDHFELIPSTKDEMLWTFDYWVEPSSDFREYLWAHNQKDVARAREIIEILPVKITHRILRYLIGSYWKRYCGWPDLLAVKGDEFIFAEVKASKDKLSEDQKRWITDNHDHLHLPFKLIKIHRLARLR